MAGLLLTFADLGLGVHFQQMLEGAGAHVTWLQGAREAACKGDWDCVLISGDELGASFTQEIDAWRARAQTPGLVVVTNSSRVMAMAKSMHVSPVASSIEMKELETEIRHAIRYRSAGELSLRMASQIVGISFAGGAQENAIKLMSAIDRAELKVVREALQHHAANYVTTTDIVGVLQKHRVLQIPDQELLRKVDGATTLRTLLRAGPTDVWRTARLLWGLACCGAVTLSRAPLDTSTITRRRTAFARRNLLARKSRLERGTFYDVLEVTPASSDDDIQLATAQLATMYKPEQFQGLDLADVQGFVDPMWRHIMRAHRTLLDPVERRKYNDWIVVHKEEVDSEWLLEGSAPERAKKFHAHGQTALVDGDLHQAVGLLANAARTQPGHPVYESTLAWATYRAAIARGDSQPEAAHKQRARAEEFVLGHRPFPNALLPMAMLCHADGDASGAIWYAQAACTVAPNFKPAQAYLDRLSRGG